MSNVDLVRRAFAAGTSRGPAALEALYDPDIEMDFAASPFADFITRGAFHGLDDVRAGFRDWYEAWENVETDLEELIDAGDHVISVFTYRGRGRSSGLELEWKHMAGVWTVRDGRIVRVAWLRTREQALAAVA